MKFARQGGAPPESRAGGPRKEAAHHALDRTHVRHSPQKIKWQRALELALDGVLEARSGDIALIERNLVESATSMLEVAGEIRRRLRHDASGSKGACHDS
jgi:hypothetical protein